MKKRRSISEKIGRIACFCVVFLLFKSCSGTQIKRTPGGGPSVLTTGSFGEDTGIEMIKTRDGDLMVKVDKNQSKAVGKIAGAWLGDQLAGHANTGIKTLSAEKTNRASDAASASLNELKETNRASEAAAALAAENVE
jgi:hypothetical protein